MPVVEFWPPQNSLATTHPMHGGFDVAPWLAEADAVLVVDSVVPWIPSRHALPPGCPVIQIGPDPTFAALPMRGFPAALAIQSDRPPLRALDAALAGRLEKARRSRPGANGSPAKSEPPGRTRSRAGAATARR